MKKLFTPSELNIVAKCRLAQYGIGDGKKAIRGGMLHVVAEHLLELMTQGGVLFNYPQRLESEDMRAAIWAAEQVLAMTETAKGQARIYREKRIKGAREDGVKDGKADIYCPDLKMLFDFKTGIKRNYKPQMAAYALQAMMTEGAESWKAIVIYMDLREIETYEFTKESAREMIKAIISAPAKPTPGPHCKFCWKKCHGSKEYK